MGHDAEQRGSATSPAELPSAAVAEAMSHLVRQRHRHRRGGPRPTSGMTLIELALAIGILAIMGTLTWSSIGRSFDAKDAVSDIDARYHNARTAMDRMSRELSMAFLTAPSRDLGLEQQWKTIFKAKKGSPFYEISFTAFAHQILREDAKESDQCEIGYFGDHDPDDRSKFVLIRREDPRIDKEPEKGGREDVLAEGVRDFKLRFFDPKDDDWTDEWDTTKADQALRLPTIVEITMVIEDEDGKDLPLITKTRINLPLAIQ
jgi:general secretion pathway protein J